MLLMYPIIYYVLVLLLCSAKEEIRPATEQIYLADPTIFQEGVMVCCNGKPAGSICIARFMVIACFMRRLRLIGKKYRLRADD